MNNELDDVQATLYRAARDRKRTAAVVSVSGMTLRGQIERYEVDPGSDTDYVRVTVKVPIRRDG